MSEGSCSQARSSKKRQRCNIPTYSPSSLSTASLSPLLLLHTTLFSLVLHAWAHLHKCSVQRMCLCTRNSLQTTSILRSTGFIYLLLRRRHLYYTLASVYNGCGCAWCAVGACHPHLHLFQAPLAECHACVIFSLSILCLVSINAHSLLITLLLLFCSPEVALHVLSLSLYPLYSSLR